VFWVMVNEVFDLMSHWGSWIGLIQGRREFLKVKPSGEWRLKSRFGRRILGFSVAFGKRMSFKVDFS